MPCWAALALRLPWWRFWDQKITQKLVIPNFDLPVLFREVTLMKVIESRGAFSRKEQTLHAVYGQD